MRAILKKNPGGPQFPEVLAHQPFVSRGHTIPAAKPSYVPSQRSRIAGDVTMILGAEIGLFFVGLYSLITGKMWAGKNAKHEVVGWPARIAGIICLLPVPLSMVAAVVLSGIIAARGQPLNHDNLFWIGTAVEGAIVTLCAIAAGAVNRLYRTPVAATSLPPQPPQDKNVGN